jgi:hypothetical protein
MGLSNGTRPYAVQASEHAVSSAQERYEPLFKTVLAVSGDFVVALRVRRMRRAVDFSPFAR